MLAKERQNAILEMLIQQGGVIKMTQIVAQFSVSNETARRDLEALQDLNLVKRVYGGALLVDRHYPHALDTPRKDAQDERGHAERTAIGLAAAALVREGETVLLSTGSTILEVAKGLKRLRQLTVLTCSLPVINELIDTQFNIHVLGGKLDNDELNMSGPVALQTIQSVFVDKTFIGAGGVTFEYGISDYSNEDSGMRSEMLRRANQTILVAHSEKFGRNAFSLGNPLEKINTVVSDSNLSEEYILGIRERGIELILANA